MNEKLFNQTIARIILATKRKKRQYSLWEVASDIDSIKKAVGIKKLSDLVGVSAGMLSQFLSVFKLPDTVIQLVRDREIDSVSMVHNLSKFDENDIVVLSALLSSSALSSQDLRVLLPYRKQFPNETIATLVKRIHASKNIKVSVIKITREDSSKTLGELSDSFQKVIGKENIVLIDSDNNSINIKITRKGEMQLREAARAKKISFQHFITSLIN